MRYFLWGCDFSIAVVVSALVVTDAAFLLRGFDEGFCDVGGTTVAFGAVLASLRWKAHFLGHAVMSFVDLFEHAYRAVCRSSAVYVSVK